MEERIYVMPRAEVDRLAKHIADDLFAQVYGAVLQDFPIAPPNRFASTMEAVGRNVLKVALDKLFPASFVDDSMPQPPI